MLMDMHIVESKHRTSNMNAYIAFSGIVQRACTLVMIVVLSACGGGDAAIDLPLRRLSDLGYQPWPVKTYVIRTDAAWQAAWDERIGPPDASVSRPAVDFSNDFVVGVSSGGGSCDSMGITRATRYGNDLVVEWSQNSPPPGVGCGGSLPLLYDFVLAPASVRGRVDIVKIN